jgi:hypothetical protein
MTRSAFVVGAAVAAACSFFGCTEDVVDTTTTGEDRMTFEEFEAQAYLEPWEGGMYIVNGDTPIDGIKNLYEFWEQLYASEGSLIVHRVGNTDAAWSSTQKLNITYCVSTSSFGSRYNAAVSAMASASGAWEAVANVNFVHLSEYDSNCTASQNNVVFDVRQVSGGGYLARAFFPNQSRSGRNVLIDTTAFGNNPPWTLAGILRHELGHSLGFRHEHTRPEAGTCFEDNSWRALTSYDSASVMHYPQCNGSQTGDLTITTKDKQGAVSLYGEPGGNPDPDPDPDPGQQTKTHSGSLSQNQFTQFPSIAVKPGTTFKVAMTGSGDPDIYVRWGSAPTTTSYNCRPYTSGANETCELTVPSNVTNAFYAVRGYTSATYNITVTWTAP